MKILFIPGTDDYDAETFEQEYAGQSVDNILRQLDRDPTLKCKNSEWEDKDSIDYRIIDVPDIVISNEFIDFIKNEFGDYDMGKSCNFYLPHQTI